MYYRDLLQPSLSDSGVLDIARVRFDVSGMNWLCDGDSVWYSPGSKMSDATGDRDWFPLSPISRSRGGGSECCGWLQFVTWGPPPINEKSRPVVPNREGGVVCVHSAGSVSILQVTG